MIDCYCCVRRDAVGVLVIACTCDNCFCAECLMCSQHCRCLGRSGCTGQDEFDPESIPPLSLLQPPTIHYYPSADTPAVVPG